MVFIEAKELKKAGKEAETKKAIQEARENFRKAVELDPADKKAKKNLYRYRLQHL